jgi:Rieske Fe-S protein
MVFDWFRHRTKPQAEKVVESPAPEVGAPGADSDLEDVAPIAVKAVMAAAIPEAAPAPLSDSVAEAASTPVAPAPATAGAVNQEALEWARQAYARLKAQQQAQKQAASPTVETPPVTPSEAAPPPESESLQPLATAEPIGAVYLRRQPGSETVEALSATCPHAGCFVEIDTQEKCFRCPCHNSRFGIDGSIMPPSPSPRGMDSLECQVGKQGVAVKWQNFYTGVAGKVARP